MNIILASESVFRRRALDVLGLSYRVVPSQLDERPYSRADPIQLVTMLSEAKTRAIGEAQENAIVVGGDAVVTLEGEILEKPRDLDDAVRMLSKMSGSTFEFVTGLAVYNANTKELLSSVRSLAITFRTLTKHEICDYVARYPVLRCAGAFEVDGMLRFTEHVEGYFNIGGALPVGDLVRFLRAQGVSV